METTGTGTAEKEVHSQQQLPEGTSDVSPPKPVELPCLAAFAILTPAATTPKLKITSSRPSWVPVG